MAINYFTLLGLETEFELDIAQLEKAHIRMQQQFHPDRLIGKPDRERGVAIQTSMDANEAYEALKNPLTRSQHLLELQGVYVNTDGEDSVKPTQALLMEIMELRERLEEASTEAQAAGIVHDVQHTLDDVMDELTDCFESSEWQTAGQLTIRLRYLGKTLEEAMMHQYRLKDVS